MTFFFISGQKVKKDYKNMNECYNELMEFEKTIYNILKGFEGQLDNVTFDLNLLDYHAYNVTEVRFIRYLQMLINANYIDGIKITPMADGSFYIKAISPTITLKGLEYLAENSMMKKIVKIIKKGAEYSLNTL